MILRFQGWLGLEGIRLITANVDNPNLSAMDLWVAYKERSLSWVEEDCEDSSKDVNYECAKHDEFRGSDTKDKDWEDRYIVGYIDEDVDEGDNKEDVDEGFNEDFEEDVESEED
ncbi:hypothetical protein DL98DRAFT_599169 [Cadophora sp. DSE1049]|nr:hypothetical protein DL98DRAFT_599169 [Cadophora sp. DSE1049]